MGLKLGFQGKLYRNTGTPGQPTWNEIPNVRDLTLTLEASEADVSTRGGGGWRATAAGLKEVTIEWEMVWDPADEDMQAIRDAWLNNASIELAAVDGGITTQGTQGIRAICAITKFTRNESLDEAMTVSVTAKPTYAQPAVQWMTVT
jgi:hypothetical protein